MYKEVLMMGCTYYLNDYIGYVTVHKFINLGGLSLMVDA